MTTPRRFLATAASIALCAGAAACSSPADTPATDPQAAPASSSAESAKSSEASEDQSASAPSPTGTANFEALRNEGRESVSALPEPQQQAAMAKPVPTQGGTPAPANAANPAYTFNPEAKATLYEEIYPQTQGKNGQYPVTVAGNQAEMCLQGNGYGIVYVMAGENTSCEFARAVAGAQFEQAGDATQILREKLAPQVRATSPVTGEQYVMECAVNANELIECTGGNAAKVLIA